MRKNIIRQHLLAEKVVSCGWLHTPDTWTAEIMSHAGWDATVVDMQHGLMSIEKTMQMLQAITTSTSVPMARASWNEPFNMMRILDSGAMGIICPMVNTKEDCEHFVSATLYPPLGIRSTGPTRAKLYAGADYVAHANEEIIKWAMVETTEAVDNVEEIVSVPHLDGVFVGSGDLRMSLHGSPAPKENDTLFYQALEKIVKYASAKELFLGIWCPSVKEAKEAIQLGFRFVAIQSDTMILTQAACNLAVELNTLKK